MRNFEQEVNQLKKVEQEKKSELSVLKNEPKDLKNVEEEVDDIVVRDLKYNEL